MSLSKLLLSTLALTSTTLAQVNIQFGNWPQQTFKTEDFVVPVFNVTKTGDPLGEGYIFFEYLTNETHEASLIMTDDGDLIWSSPTFNKTSNTFVQDVYGEPVLTYWTGVGNTNTNRLGHGYGQVHFLDTTYTEIYDICPDFGLVFINNSVQACQADAHESYVNAAKNTLLVTAYNLTQTDLTPIGGPVDGWIWDCLFYEIDIKSQAILFSWSALGAGLTPNLSKNPRNSSGTAQDDPYDWFHINSVQSIGDGYLINARDTWTSYMLNSNGDIEWEFEGSHGGDFQKPENVSFEWEHHVRAHNVTNTSMILTMFDNANSSPPFYNVNQTLGLMWYLNFTTKVATVLQDKFVPSSPLYASTQGSNEWMENGNTLMGYGDLPYIREFGPEGDLRMNIRFANYSNDGSYRTYRLPWTATPAAAPKAVVEDGMVYMSWNGATNVTNWAIYEGQTSMALQRTSIIKNDGFETSTAISNGTAFVQVMPLNGTTVMANSTVVAVA